MPIFGKYKTREEQLQAAIKEQKAKPTRAKEEVAKAEKATKTKKKGKKKCPVWIRPEDCK